MKSTNIVFTGPRQAECIEEDLPDPQPGEITVQTTLSHISTGTESWCYRGEFDTATHWDRWVRYPFHPGYSNVGRVVRVGDGITELQKGDRVWSPAQHRQFANIKVGELPTVKLTEQDREEDAAWIALSMIAQTAVRRAEHSLGDAAVVIGLGPVGQLVAQFLRVSGLKEVLAIDTASKRLEIATAHDATHAFQGSAADAVEFVKLHTEGRLADVVFDVTGHYAVLPMALKLARTHGKVILLGDSPHPSKQHLTHDVLTRQVTVIGTHTDQLPPALAFWTGARQAQLFLEFCRRGLMHMSDLITHRFSPTEAAKVYADLQHDRGETLGILYDWRDV
jgi:2-desacetyl-2-hydroxyethyl bacteriochlorophyllide A dehydrogenase